METKTLLSGLIGFFIGGLLVSVAATTFEKNELQDSSSSHSVASLEQKTGGEFDKAFIEEMIVHHESAVTMARLAETRAEHTEIKDLSRDIITAQSQEIDKMQTWQSDWGYKETPKSHQTSSH